MNLKLYFFFFLGLWYCSIEGRAQTPEELARTKIDSLKTLIGMAEENHIEVQRELMTIETAELFLKYADWDQENIALNKGLFEEVYNFKSQSSTLANELPLFERTEVVKILDDAIARLNKVLKGEYARQRATEVDYTKAEIVGSEIQVDGKPVFLIDYNFKPESSEYRKYFGAMDGGYITANYIKEGGTMGQWVYDMFNSKKSSRMGSVFIDQNNIPDWAYTKYDGLDFGSRTFGKYDLDHPGAKELYSLYFKNLVPLVAGKRYTKLGYELFNEPSFFTQQGVWNTAGVSIYTLDKFRSWLANKHQNIKTLNELWGSSFANFDEVTITIPISGTLQGTPKWYDWCAFNNDRVTAWMRWMKEEIQKYDPQGFVNLKLMPWLWLGDKPDDGIDFEALTRMSGTISCDAAAKNSDIYGAHEYWNDYYAFEWKEISMMYDFFKSVAPDKIIFDSETHFLSSVHFRDLYLKPEYARATYWLAFMHGLNASRNWVWGREDDGSIDSGVGGGHAGSIMQQPAVMNELHATFIDANTFPVELSTIQQMRKPIRIYYSKANFIQRKSYMQDVFDTYEALNFKGVPLGFATDSILLTQKSTDWDVIVVRATEMVTQQEFSTLQNYLNNGGTVVLDNVSFKTNEYGQSFPELVSGAGRIIKAAALSDAVTNALSLLNEDEVWGNLSLSQSNGTNHNGCIWRTYLADDGKQILSVVNVGKNDATLDIKLKGAAYGTACKDLIKGIWVSNQPVLKPYEVYFVEISDQKVTPTGTQNVKETPEEKIVFFPNPVSSVFSIDLQSLQKKTNLKIFSSTGVLLFERNYMGGQLITEDISDFPSGIYFLNLTAGQTVRKQSFIKE